MIRKLRKILVVSASLFSRVFFLPSPNILDVIGALQLKGGIHGLVPFEFSAQQSKVRYMTQCLYEDSKLSAPVCCLLCRHNWLKPVYGQIVHSISAPYQPEGFKCTG